MKINPNYKELLADFITVEDPDEILKECFALEYEDWENAFELISQFGCSEEYEAQFKRYYSSWSKGFSYYEPSEWVRELEDKLMENQTEDEVKSDIEFEIIVRFGEAWNEEYSSFYDNIIKPLEKLKENYSELMLLQMNGVEIKVDFSEYKRGEFSKSMFSETTELGED
jgi:hypothetical protein